MEKDTITRDNREARFYYPPCPNWFKQLPPSFQRMAQEQPANQHQQQQHFQHSWGNRCNTIIAHSTSIPADPQVYTDAEEGQWSFK